MEVKMLKKYVNKLAVNIVDKNGSGDSNYTDDVEEYLIMNPKIFAKVDIAGCNFEQLVRTKINFLYKVGYNLAPWYKKYLKENNLKYYDGKVKQINNWRLT
jgi:hypothetical protein